MEEHIKSNIIRILNKAIELLKKKDFKGLKDLSNESVHDATVYQEEYSISVAVLIYSLSKIHERDYYYGNFKGWGHFCASCFGSLERARGKLVGDDYIGFGKAIQDYILSLKKMDPSLKRHIQDVLNKAKINKASRLYEHGISLGRTAELLGITKFELMDYVGKTYIADAKENVTISAANRLKFVRGLFK